ncbi:acyl-CoA desaturase [Kangiella sp. TOML190]|uniref:acyl-CoA desaturase n=1 Tax=Kangiella sp. TOML190 TaxID=2931351 RepID=UPI00203A4224|nr:acyl-CoA desaturase [Kangiella sp. TOML190]
MKKWFDNSLVVTKGGQEAMDGIDWPRVIPFIFLHLACLSVIWVGVSSIAVIIFAISYLIRMFAITAFYHRYFSHKTFRVGRVTQFIFAFIGTTATQRGPLWWAAHHRHHHIHSDKDADLHSPAQGFWKSHMFWFLNKKNFPTNLERVKDLARYRELVWLDRYDIIPPILFAALIFSVGIIVEVYFPQLGASKWQILIWGYFISTVVLAHITFSINSVAHRWGTKRFDTNDNSRNNWLLAILTLGEGWHNNHHRFPYSAKQGVYWWELDLSYYGLYLLKTFGLVHDLKAPNAEQINKAMSS